MSWEETDPQSGVKIIDRRGGESPKPRDDSGRLARRKVAKRNLAAAKLAEYRRQRQVELIQKVGLEKMRLADQHLTDCAPLRAELKTLDSHQVDLVLSNMTPDPDLEARRRELADAIHASNKALADGIAAADAKLNQLECERIEFAKAAAIADAERELFDTGDPDLIRRMHMIRREHGGNLFGETVDTLYKRIISE